MSPRSVEIDLRFCLPSSTEFRRPDDRSYPHYKTLTQYSTHIDGRHDVLRQYAMSRRQPTFIARSHYFSFFTACV